MPTLHNDVIFRFEVLRNCHIASMLLPDPLLIYTVSPTGSTKDIPGPVTFTPCYERNSITLSYSPLGRDGRPSSLICNSFELGPQRIIKAKRTLLHQADVVISFPDSPLIIRARMPNMSRRSGSARFQPATRVSACIGIPRIEYTTYLPRRYGGRRKWRKLPPDDGRIRSLDYRRFSNRKFDNSRIVDAEDRHPARV